MKDEWVVRVSAGAVKVRRPERGGSYCTFTLFFMIGTVNHQLVERYSMLRQFHSKLCGVVNDVPSFPPKTWIFQSTTNAKFQEKRKSALLDYFQTLVQNPCILKQKTFHKLLNLSDNLGRKMIQIGEDLDAKRYILEQYLDGGCSSSTSDYK